VGCSERTTSQASSALQRRRLGSPPRRAASAQGLAHGRPSSLAGFRRRSQPRRSKQRSAEPLLLRRSQAAPHAARAVEGLAEAIRLPCRQIKRDDPSHQGLPTSMSLPRRLCSGSSRRAIVHARCQALGARARERRLRAIVSSLHSVQRPRRARRRSANGGSRVQEHPSPRPRVEGGERASAQGERLRQRPQRARDAEDPLQRPAGFPIRGVSRRR